MSGQPIPRGIKFLIGLALLGLCVYEVYTGRARGRFRTYDRYDEPWSFWSSIVVKLALTCGFLCGVE
jgi:hypothetical protein